MKMAYYHKTKSGKYEVTVYAGKDPATGEYIRKTQRFAKKEEAKLWVSGMIIKKSKGIPTNPKEYTVKDYLLQWLSDYVEVNLSPTTYDDYRTTITGHIIPALGALKLEELQPQHIQTYQSDKLKNGRKDGKGGLSKRTVQKHHRILSKALKQATLLHLIPSNPCQPVPAPSLDKKEVDALTTEQLTKLLQLTENTDIHAIIMTAVYTGMRRSEILGLSWDNVNLKRKKIYVKQTLVSKTGEGAIIKTYTKNNSSRRTIDISDTLINVLKKVQWRQKKLKKYYKKQAKEDNLVFCHEDGSKLSPDNPGRNLNRIVEATELEWVTLHKLRHTHATLMIENGVDIKIVTERLGHSTTTTTHDIYVHATETMQKEAVDIFEKNIRESHF